MVFSTTKNPTASLGCGLMMAMVFHCPRVVTLDLHKAQKIGVGDEIIGVLLYTSKKRWRNRGNESTPLSFFKRDERLCWEIIRGFRLRFLFHREIAGTLRMVP